MVLYGTTSDCLLNRNRSRDNKIILRNTSKSGKTTMTRFPLSSLIRWTALFSLLLIFSPFTNAKRPFLTNHVTAPSTPLFDNIRGGAGKPSTASPSTKLKPSSTSSSSSASKIETSSNAAIVEGLKNTLASGMAAACSKTILAPFDTLKTVQQHVEGGTSLGLVEAARRVTSRPGGVLNLYAGLGVSALGSMPSVGLYFGVYSYCKKVISPMLKRCLGSEREDGKKGVCSDGGLYTFSIALSAAIGNTVASFSRVPYEVVKQCLQTGQYSSTKEALVTMWKAGGLRSFFPLGGVSIQMLRDIPYAIFTLLSYEYIKDNWVLKKSENDPNKRWIRDMIAGATAGGIGSYLTNPLDVIKTRLQTVGSGGVAPYGGSISACAVAVLEEGGLMAFLRGSVPRLMHKIPANGCFFVFYEFFRRVLKVE